MTLIPCVDVFVVPSSSRYNVMSFWFDRYAKNRPFGDQDGPDPGAILRDTRLVRSKMKISSFKQYTKDLESGDQEKAAGL